MGEEYILGVNGWDLQSHDSSAVLLHCSDSGIEVVAAAEEERFTRQRHAYNSFPLNATNFCLSQAGIQPQDLSAVSICWDMLGHYAARGMNFDVTDKHVIESILGIQSDVPLIYTPHHLSHALSSYGPSGFTNSSVLVIDGQGETESTTVWRANRNELSQISKSLIGSSLGYFYEAVTEFIGFSSDQAGKTMGLAPYGNSSQFFDQLRSLFFVKDGVVHVKGSDYVSLGKSGIDEQEQLRTLWFKHLTKISRTNSLPRSNKYSFRQFPQPYCDLSASAQAVLEDVIMEIVDQVAPSGDICLAGGVALNCVSNGKVGRGRNIYVQPAANDAGAALGAALHVAKQKGFSITQVPFSPYAGQEFSNEEIECALSGSNYTSSDDLSDQIANLVSSGKVVGLFQGRFEFGSRALGNRSFIARANSRLTLDYINSNIKGREEGRPLAPALLESECASVFGELVYGPHMTITYGVMTDTVPAVTHVDSSTRPQIVTKTSNPLFHHQLNKIKDRTGVGVVINTSLNFQEPIVTTPAQALSLLHRTGVDAIAFNNQYLCQRRTK